MTTRHDARVTSLVAPPQHGPPLHRPERASPAAAHRHRHPGWLVALVVLLSATVWTLLGDVTDRPAAPRTQGGVDFGDVVQRVDPYAVGLGSSTYGATVATSTVEATNERRLDARTVRVPVAVTGEVVHSGAAGASRVPVVPLVRTYLSWGYHVLVVIDGSGPGGAATPGEARAIIAALGYGNGVSYSTANEPDAAGRSVQDAVTAARTIVQAGRALYPGFRVVGPAWSRYDRTALRTFAAALGPALAALDFHAYAMGETPVPTDEAMRSPDALGAEVRQTVADLRSLGLSAGVAVDELNLSWRWLDGAPGGETRLLSAVNTVWLADACGQVLLAGGQCLPYANQNGPLGMLVQAGEPPLDRPPLTPTPGYWGIASWTGAGLFPHLAGTFFAVDVTVPGIDVYAVDNEAGGRTLVVVDTRTTPGPTPLVLGVRHLAAGRYVPFTTDPAHPFEAPVAGPAVAYTTTVSLVVHPMTVTTLVMTPGT